MRRIRLLWQLYPSYLAITVVAILLTGWYVGNALRTIYIDRTADDLEVRARLVRQLLNIPLGPQNEEIIDRLCKELGRQTQTRITVILRDGLVVGDSDEDPRHMDNHRTRREIVSVLDGGVGVSTRLSHTLHQDMMYVAIAVKENGGVTGIVRTAIPMTVLGETLRIIYVRIAIGGLLAVLLAAAVSFLVSQRLSRPLEIMRRGAQRFAQGNLKGRLPVAHSEEIGGLAEAMNRMAAQLDDRIRVVLQQRNEQEAVLTSMVEAVIAVDMEERILRVNRAARHLFQVGAGNLEGRPVQEVVRKADIQSFIRRVLKSREPVEEDIDLWVEGRNVFLQAHGSVLRDARGQDIGALVVLNDMTRLRRLETMRQEFVANVSHELKTPITAIKGSVETLMSGASDDPETSQRFLEIVGRQADRLNAIIDDLLALSRIEQDAEGGQLALEDAFLRPILEAAIQSCDLAAQKKEVGLELSCPSKIRVMLNAHLLEQAVVNLLTNAIKYSPAQGLVLIEVTAGEGTVSIAVRDSGVGISPEHLPRLFERFYRVDKARSRKLGGTGLGLAIVKHIVQAHGGRVEVVSRATEGSTFTIILPTWS